MRRTIQTPLLLLALATLLGAAPGRGCATADVPDEFPPEDPPECPPVCLIYCEYGNVLDANDCPTCECNPAPSCTSDADCGEGHHCACYWGDPEPAPTPRDPTEPDGNGDAADPSEPTGFRAPPPTECSCAPNEPPPPPTCDPNVMNACGDGATCVCAFDLIACEPDTECIVPAPHCWCEVAPPPPPVCDPSVEYACGEGSECVCVMAAQVCEPDGDCTAPIRCWCEPVAPPPVSCDPSAPSCAEGESCECAVVMPATEGDFTCDPSEPSCGAPLPPPPECYCVPHPCDDPPPSPEPTRPEPPRGG